MLRREPLSRDELVRIMRGKLIGRRSRDHEPRVETLRGVRRSHEPREVAQADGVESEALALDDLVERDVERPAVRTETISGRYVAEVERLAVTVREQYAYLLEDLADRGDPTREGLVVREVLREQALTVSIVHAGAPGRELGVALFDAAAREDVRTSLESAPDDRSAMKSSRPRSPSRTSTTVVASGTRVSSTNENLAPRERRWIDGSYSAT
jgi:hypothetical protein